MINTVEKLFLELQNEITIYEMDLVDISENKIVVSEIPRKQEIESYDLPKINFWTHDVKGITFVVLKKINEKGPYLIIKISYNTTFFISNRNGYKKISNYEYDRTNSTLLTLMVIEEHDTLVLSLKNEYRKSYYPFNFNKYFFLLSYLKENEYLKSYSFFEKIISSFLPKNNGFLRDIQNDSTMLLYWKIPITIKDLQYHSRKEWLENKFHTNFPKSANKKNIMISYHIYKLKSKVSEEDFRRLLNIDYNQVIEYLNYRYKNDSDTNIKNLIFECYYIYKFYNGYEETEEFTDDEYYTIQDYIYMCLKYKVKLNLHVKSYNRLVQEHNSVSEKLYMKKTPKVEIVKKSIFNKVDAFLSNPPFEKICTRKRLLQEVNMMHHCVWSYADDINKDKCAIYSYVNEDTKERYTIEIVMKRKKYFVNQVQSKYNQGCPEKIKSYINSFIQKANH